MAGLVEFFWNLIPGSLFLFALSIIPDIELISSVNKWDPNNTVLTGGLFAILALFLGFLFQEIGTLLIKSRLQAEFIDSIENNEKNKVIKQSLDKLVINKFKKKIDLSKQNGPNDLKVPDYKKAFHFIHNYLWATNQTSTATLADFFNARASLWVNTAIAAIFYTYFLIFLIIRLEIFEYTDNTSIYLLMAFASILLGLFSMNFAKSNLEIFYDVLLKSFVAVTDEELIKSQNKSDSS